MTTAYTLDMAGGLTQVLSDGTHTYLYGNRRIARRIAQYSGTAPEYFLPDALGSVRQITDSSGEVTLAQTYQPFGEILSQGGAGQSPYGYAGEWEDSESGLVYLRARHYSPYLTSSSSLILLYQTLTSPGSGTFTHIHETIQSGLRIQAENIRLTQATKPPLRRWPYSSSDIPTPAPGNRMVHNRWEVKPDGSLSETALKRADYMSSRMPGWITAIILAR